MDNNESDLNLEGNIKHSSSNMGGSNYYKDTDINASNDLNDLRYSDI